MLRDEQGAATMGRAWDAEDGMVMSSPPIVADPLAP